MITAAWEAGHAVIVALLLWLAAGVLVAGMAVAAVAVGVRGVWRGLCGAVAASRALRALPAARAAHDASGGRAGLRAAPDPSTEPTAMASRSTRIRRWSASQGRGGGFPAPAAPSPAQSRTELSTRQETR